MTRLLAALGIAAVLFGCQAQETAPPPGPAADSSAARDVLRHYYSAIAARDFPSAYALWSRGGEASGQSYDQFASGFALTARTQVEFTGPVTFEGAAGSIFATVPVRVRATTTAGEDQEFTGVYELRRVNDVPGATPDQLRWHIHGARLEPVK
jgi:hypothetical protein